MGKDHFTARCWWWALVGVLRWIFCVDLSLSAAGAMNRMKTISAHLPTTTKTPIDRLVVESWQLLSLSVLWWLHMLRKSREHDNTRGNKKKKWQPLHMNYVSCVRRFIDRQHARTVYKRTRAHVHIRSSTHSFIWQTPYISIAEVQRQKRHCITDLSNPFPTVAHGNIFHCRSN